MFISRWVFLKHCCFPTSHHPYDCPFNFRAKCMCTECGVHVTLCYVNVLFLYIFFLIRPLLTLFYNVKSFQLTQNEKFVKGSLAHCKWFAVISFWVLESNVCSNCSFPFKMTIDRLVNMCIGMEYIYVEVFVTSKHSIVLRK